MNAIMHSVLLLGIVALFGGCARHARHDHTGFAKELPDGNVGWVEVLGRGGDFRLQHSQLYPFPDVILRRGWVYATGDVVTIRTDLVVAQAVGGRVIVQRRPKSQDGAMPAHDRVIFLTVGPGHEGRVWAHRPNIESTDPGRPVRPGHYIDAYRDGDTIRFGLAKPFDDKAFAQVVRDQRVEHQVP